MWETLLANKAVRFAIAVIVFLLFLFAIFLGGRYLQHQIDSAMDKAAENITKEVQKSLQSSLNKKIDDLDNKINTHFDDINGKFDAQTKNINDTRANMANLNTAWLRVEKVRTSAEHLGNAGGSGGQSTGSQAGGDGTYYAQLPAEDVQFLKGEAYRGDQCAVRLGAAQEALLEYRGAFQRYQELVGTYLSAAKVSKSK